MSSERKYMAEVMFAFGRPWSFRMPILIRQLKTEYVAEFYTFKMAAYVYPLLIRFETTRMNCDTILRRDGWLAYGGRVTSMQPPLATAIIANLIRDRTHTKAIGSTDVVSG